MRAWKRWIGAGVAVVAATAGLATVVVDQTAAVAATSTSCPLASLKKATKPVEITFWHDAGGVDELLILGVVLDGLAVEVSCESQWLQVGVEDGVGLRQ